jgi:c-di-GMP-binding flagellar brake protein YcgR
MRFDEAVERMASNHLEYETENQDSGFDTYTPPIQIPLKIDDAILVRSLTNMAHTAKSRVVGAVQGKFILITEPTVNINGRIWAVLDEAFLCSYFSDGSLYTFRSRYQRRLIDDIVSIDYPSEAEIRQVRKHRRISVNIETQCAMPGIRETVSADMTDISLGGCRLLFEHRLPVKKGAELYLTFNLPNEAFVTGLRSMVMRIDRNPENDTAEVGLSFSGPRGEIAKISNFCEFCMFFDLNETKMEV